MIWNLAVEQLRRLRLRSILNTNRLVKYSDLKVKESRFEYPNLTMLLNPNLKAIMLQLKRKMILKENGHKSNDQVILASVTRVWMTK